MLLAHGGVREPRGSFSDKLADGVRDVVTSGELLSGGAHVPAFELAVPSNVFAPVATLMS